MKNFLLCTMVVLWTISTTGCPEPGVDTPAIGAQPKLSPAAEDGAPNVQTIE